MLIKRMKRLINNFKFRYKIIIICIVSVILPMTVISLVFCTVLVRKINEQKLSELQNSVDMACYSLDSIFENIMVVSDMIFYDDAICNVLNFESKNTAEIIEAVHELDRIISLFYVDGRITKIVFYTDNENLINGVSVIKTQYAGKELGMIESFKQSDSDVAVKSMVNNETGLMNMMLLRRLKGRRFTGNEVVLKIEINASMVRDIIKGSSNEENLYLLDDSGNVIACSNASADVSKISDKEMDGYVSAELDLPGDYKIVSKPDFVLFNVEMIMFIGMVILIMIVSVCAIWAVTRTHIIKISKLEECSKKLCNGVFEPIAVEDVGMDEIGNLMSGMNKAVLSIRRLLDEVRDLNKKQIENEKEKNMAILNALNSQINPHFMFNILDVIRMKLLKRGDTETAEVMENISVMFRKLITWGDDFIPIAKELEFVNAYINVQYYSMFGEFDMDIDIDEKALDAMLPKMSIQVFVENAFVHGFENSLNEKKFVLWIKKLGERIIITICDNGAGMSKEIADSINNGSFDIVGSKRVGITNVVKRIQLCYENNFNIAVESIPECFTKIVLDLPYISRE